MCVLDCVCTSMCVYQFVCVPVFVWICMGEYLYMCVLDCVCTWECAYLWVSLPVYLVYWTTCVKNVWVLLRSSPIEVRLLSPRAVGASSQCYLDSELMLLKYELMLLKCQINTNTNWINFCLLQNVEERVLKYSYLVSIP